MFSSTGLLKQLEPKTLNLFWIRGFNDTEKSLCSSLNDETTEFVSLSVSSLILWRLISDSTFSKRDSWGESGDAVKLVGPDEVVENGLWLSLFEEVRRLVKWLDLKEFLDVAVVL